MAEILQLDASGGFRANCYLVWSQDEAALIDPTADPDQVAAALAARGLRLRYILLTHAHYDHLMTLYDASAFADLPVYIHAADAPALGDVRALVADLFGVRIPLPPREVQTLSDGDTLPLGDEEITVYHTPGHTPGSVCYGSGDRWLTGDTLFADSIGATRFPGGDSDLLFSSLARILIAPPAHIYPGHGGDAPMAEVLRYNPYLRSLTQGM